MDGFFNFVRWFRELEPQHNEDATSGGDRVVTPRNDSAFSRLVSSSPAKIHSHKQYHTSELSLDEQLALEAAEHLANGVRVVPQTSPPSCRRVALERHVRHTLPNGEDFPRKRSTRKNWWQEMEQVDLVLMPPELVNLDTSATTPDPNVGSHVAASGADCLKERIEEEDRDQTTREAPVASNEVSTARTASPRALPPVSRTSAAQFGRHKPKARPAHPETTAPVTTALSSSNMPIHVHEKQQSRVDPRYLAPPTQLDRRDDLVHRADEQTLASAGNDSQLGGKTSCPSTTLAKGSSQSATATPEIPETHNQHINVTFAASTTASNAIRQLARSESAPESLELHRWTGERQRAKHMRGLCGGLEQDPEYHVERDCATRILRKQCEDAYVHSAVRIRHSKTPAAQSRIFQARVRRALGQRQLPAVDASQRPSALVRPDRLTMERAASVLALSEQYRALTHSLSTTDALASGTILHERSAAAPPPHSPLSPSR